MVPSIAAGKILETTLVVEEVHSWQAPQPEDDGVSLLAATVAKLPRAFGSKGRLGVSLGHESTVRMPAANLRTLEDQLRDCGWGMRNSSRLMQRVVAVKSDAEVAKIRRACVVASNAMHSLDARLASFSARGGVLTERVAVKQLQSEILDLEGCDDVPYLIAVSRADGYSDIITGPTDKPLLRGDMLVIDVGARFDGYFCDFDRNWSIGAAPTDEYTRANEILYRAVSAGIAAAKPGVKCSEVYHAMANLIAAACPSDTPSNVGRFGHGLGLQLTEWPSIHPDDHTLLEVNFVMAIEPSMALSRGRMICHEENVVIRETGAELLTVRAPRAIPVVALARGAATASSKL